MRKIIEKTLAAVLIVSFIAVLLPAEPAQAKTKYKYLDDVFGISREEFVAQLAAHEADDYYIGTPYLGGDNRNAKGDPNHKWGVDDRKGVPGFNCTGFVWRALVDAGVDYNLIPLLTVGSKCWDNPKPGKGNSWWRFIKGDDGYYPYYYFFDSVEDLLASGKAEKGDIIYLLQTGAPSKKTGEVDSHVGIFWGESPSHDKFFHSGPTTNYGGTNKTCISTINAVSPSYYYLLKWKPAENTGWKKENDQWYYYNPAGMVKGKWVSISGKWYHFNRNGVMQTGWLETPQGNYYLDAEGAMQTGWKKSDNTWYYLDSNDSGRMSSGWKQIKDNWYHFAKGGAIHLGWQKIGGKWYWFNSLGVMQTGWKQISGKWYCFDKTGIMYTGWKFINGMWYYFNRSGVMLTGWQKINNRWYYFNAAGRMYTGRHSIGGKTYTFRNDGVWIS